MNKDIILLRSVEVAAIATYKYIGKKDKNLIDKAAVEALQVMLKNEKGFQLKIVNGEGELDNAPMLYVGEILGDVSNPQSPIFDVAVDPVEGTYPAAYNFAGSIAAIAIARENSMLQLPEMYMEKLFISDEFTNKITMGDNIIETVKDMQILAQRKDLKCIILDKPRHHDVIEQLSQMGVVVRTIQDGDVLAAIDVVNKEADFVYGIGGAPEGGLMAALAIASGSAMFCRLVPYAQVWPNESETKSRTIKENAWIAKHQIDFSTILSDFDLISDKRTRFFAAGITAGGTLKPINYKDGKFFVNAFIASHGIVRNVKTIYDVKKVNELKPDIKYLFDKYKR